MATVRVVYDKLIRDRMPEVIEAEGHFCRTEILDDAAYIHALKRKLVEEADEVLKASSPDEIIAELADLCEVIDALLVASDIRREALEVVQEERRRSRGAFAKRLLLRHVDRFDGSTID
jgi:predicted house-cleaning noncanonical NTP pyrophosphatase (MazG superfamily)